MDLAAGLHVDFETHSACDLRKGGPWVYSEHWTSDIWCCAYALGREDVKLWWPGDPVPLEITHAAAKGLPFLAHNSGFERAIFGNIAGPRYGWPVPPLDQWVCTAAMAAAMALPRGLDNAARVMGVDQRKDADGHNLMLRMARPRSTTKIRCIVCGMMKCDHHLMFKTSLVWWEDEERKRRLGEYCMQDVRTERALCEVLVPLSPGERRTWLHNELVNERGVAVDLQFVRRAAVLAKEIVAELNEQIASTTNGFVKATTQVQKLRLWLALEGYPIESLRRTVVDELLKGNKIDGIFREAIELRKEGAKSSTAKLNALINRTCIDWRARDSLMYHGAATGRVSGRGFQPQNLPRPIPELGPYTDEAVDLIRNGCDLATFKGALMLWELDQHANAASRGQEPIPFRALDMISVCLRPCLVGQLSIPAAGARNDNFAASDQAA